MKDWRPCIRQFEKQMSAEPRKLTAIPCRRTAKFRFVKARPETTQPKMSRTYWKDTVTNIKLMETKGTVLSLNYWEKQVLNKEHVPRLRSSMTSPLISLEHIPWRYEK
mmetsp:Transcript_18802/g.34095  ORF Transcript_18802/g.34095 Transcript_18802/m.34095 type:complete len:108 (+) Transcript_18802:152-475(+)